MLQAQDDQASWRSLLCVAQSMGYCQEVGDACRRLQRCGYRDCTVWTLARLPPKGAMWTEEARDWPQ